MKIKKNKHKFQKGHHKEAKKHEVEVLKQVVGAAASPAEPTHAAHEHEARHLEDIFAARNKEGKKHHHHF